MIISPGIFRYGLLRVDSGRKNKVVKDPYIGSSIPPPATKNLNTPLAGLFSFMAYQD